MPQTFDPAQAAYQAWLANNPALYQQAIAPYLGQEVQSRLHTDPNAEGFGDQSFQEFLNPITGQWERSAQWADPSRTVYEGGSGGYRTSNDMWVRPFLNYEQGPDGKFHIKDGSYDVKEYTKGVTPTDALIMATIAAGGYLAGNGGLGANTAGAANGSWDVLPAASGAPNTAAMGSGAGGFAGDATAAGYGGLDAASTATMGGGASVAGGAALPAAAGGGSNFLSNLIPNGASSLLGPAATLLGAAAGAKGQQSSQTQTRDIPDWLKPYVTGQGGLLDQTNTLMRDQMTRVPQQAQQISNVGMGLLQQPMAGNGFQQFMQRPRFGGY